MPVFSQGPGEVLEGIVVEPAPITEFTSIYLCIPIPFSHSPVPGGLRRPRSSPGAASKAWGCLERTGGFATRPGSLNQFIKGTIAALAESEDLPFPLSVSPIADRRSRDVKRGFYREILSETQRARSV